MRFAQPLTNVLRGRARGFFLVVVVMALAIASAVVVGQLSTSRSEAISAVRVEEEVQARAIAEGCLGLLQGYVDGYMDPVAPAFDDFDLLLDRDSTLGTADDYQPNITGAVAVQVPKGTADTRHRWQFLKRGPPGKQGACYMRIDDNSDDGLALASVQLPATGLNEGPAVNDGRDNPLRDRDRAINLTVIGVFPALPGVVNADVWDRAHARVTLKRLHAVINTPQAVPAISACGDINFGNAAEFCGTGGLSATGDVNLSNSCACGSLQGNTFTPATPPAQCACCTAPGTTASPGSPAPCPAIPTPPEHSYLAISGFGDPNNVGGINLGDTAQCKVFVTDDGAARPATAFMWDVTDSTPLTTLQTIFSIPAGNFAGGADTDCRNYSGVANFTGIGAEAEVERPCDWTFTGGGAQPTITCGPNETLCWKPMGYLDQVDNTPDFALGSAAQFEWESTDSSGADVMFYKTQPVPYIRDATKRLVAGANTLCGATAGVCDSCESGGPNRGSGQWLLECDDPLPPCDDFHAHGRTSNSYFPAPTIFVIETAAGKNVELEQPGGDTEPIWATWLLNRTPDIRTASGFCSAMMPSGCKGPMTGKTIAAASCVTGNAQVPGSPYFAFPPPPRPAANLRTYPLVLRVNGTNAEQCTLARNNTFVGTVECPGVYLPDNPCIVGDIVATNQFSGGAVSACSTAQCDPAGAPDIGVCFSDLSAANSMTWSVGSVCGGNTNNATFNMDFVTLGNVDFKNQISINGTITAQGDVNFKNSAKVTNLATSFLTSGTQGLVSFMECSW